MPPLLPSPPYSSFLVDAHCHLIQASSSAAAAAASLKRTALDAANPDAFPAPQTAPTTTLFSMTCSLKEARELNWCLERAKCQQPPSPSSSSPRRYLMVPCFGIHPWFIKQHLRETAVDSSSSITCFKSENITQKSFQSRPSNPLFHSCQRILDLLESFLVDHPASESSQSNWSHAAIIGEIGLDGLVTGGGGNNDGSSSCSHHPLGDGGVPLETQTAVFLAQLLLAFKLGRPVSVHAVKCWPLLLDVLECLGIWIGLEPAKKRRKSPPSESMQSIFTLLEQTPGASQLKSTNLPPPPILLHSFSGSPETVSQITTSRLPPALASQIFFSISRIVHSRYPVDKRKRIINAIPENRLLLESDLTDVLEIEDALREAASIVAQAKCWTDSAHAATFGSSSSSSSTTPTTTSADQDKTSATTTIDAVGINRVIELSNRNTNSFYAMNSVREDGTVDVLPLQAIPFVMDKWFQARLEYKEEVENATL